MRSALVILGFIIFFLVTLPAFLILLVIRRFNKHLSSSIAQVFVRIGFRFVYFFTGSKVTVLGLENVPKNTAVEYVGNHRSLFDTVLAYSYVPTLTGFVSKIEMKKVPFLSWWMILTNCIFLERSDMRAGLKMILDGIENVKQGYSIYIAPEGTRNHRDELLPFKEGSLKIAEKTGCPIIPVAISGTDDVLELRWPWIHKAAAVIEFGKPIYPNELYGDDKKFMGAYCRNKIIEMLKGHEPYIVNNPTFQHPELKQTMIAAQEAKEAEKQRAKEERAKLSREAAKEHNAAKKLRPSKLSKSE